MKKSLKIIPLFFLFALFLQNALFSEEEIAITNYYPSPSGNYQEVRLLPHAAMTSCGLQQTGLLYYDSQEHSFKICKYDSGSFQYKYMPLGGTVIWQPESGTNNIYALPPKPPEKAMIYGIGQAVTVSSDAKLNTGFRAHFIAETGNPYITIGSDNTNGDGCRIKFDKSGFMQMGVNGSTGIYLDRNYYYIGIGTENPTGNLEVAGRGKPEGAGITLYEPVGNLRGGIWRFDDSIGIGKTAGMFPNAVLGSTNKLDAGELRFGVRSSINKHEYIRITKAGDVILSPTVAPEIALAKLNVKMPMYIYGLIHSESTSQPVFCDNNGKLYLEPVTSDLRLKKDISSLSSRLNVLEALDKMRAVYFRWDTSKEKVKGLDNNMHIGMIAQEVEPELPELVNTGSDGYKSLDYEKLSAFLIEVCKKQQEQIKLGKALITEQKQKLDGLEHKIKQVKQALKK